MSKLLVEYTVVLSFNFFNLHLVVLWYHRFTKPNACNWFPQWGIRFNYGCLNTKLRNSLKDNWTVFSGASKSQSCSSVLMLQAYVSKQVLVIYVCSSWQLWIQYVRTGYIIWSWTDFFSILFRSAQLSFALERIFTLNRIKQRNTIVCGVSLNCVLFNGCVKLLLRVNKVVRGEKQNREVSECHFQQLLVHFLSKSSYFLLAKKVRTMHLQYV